MNTKINTHVQTSFQKCTHEIRNMKPLTKELINEIKNMSSIEKIEIILLYDEILQSVIESLNSDLSNKIYLPDQNRE